jgi:ABC-type enterochelin transport system ATPase subunit
MKYDLLSEFGLTLIMFKRFLYNIKIIKTRREGKTQSIDEAMENINLQNFKFQMINELSGFA